MINLKRDTQLVCARDEYNFPIDAYDDGDGPIWLFGHEFGATMVIRAGSFETAWEIAIDEAKTIDESEVAEAYGFDGEHGALELRQAGERADATGEDYPELIEGYEYQSNSSDTGIVNVGHYAWLREMQRDDADKVRLVVRHDDDADDAESVKFKLESYAYTMTVRGKSKTFVSYSLLSDIGERIRRLERVFGAMRVEREWVSN